MEGESSIYFVNSADRLSGTSDNFSYDISIPDNSNYDRVTLMNCNIPISYYLIQSGFNSFTLKEDNTLIQISVTPGNYSTTTFITELVPLLNLATTHSLTYAMKLNPTTGKYTYSITGNTSHISVSIICTANVHEQLGFNANTTNTFITDILKSSNVVNFIPESCLLIHSDICDNNENSVLQEVLSNNSSTFANVVYQCTDIECSSRKLRTNTSNTYTFSLTNKNGRSINLNGLNINFTIVLFRRSTFSEIFKQYIKYNLSRN